MLTDKAMKAIYKHCAICVDNLGYVDDAPKFAGERGLKRHLRDVHNVVENRKPRFTL